VAANLQLLRADVLAQLWADIAAIGGNS